MSGPIQDPNPFTFPHNITKQDFLSHIAQTRSTMSAKNWTFVLNDSNFISKFSSEIKQDLIKKFNLYIYQIYSLRNYL